MDLLPVHRGILLKGRLVGLGLADLPLLRDTLLDQVKAFLLALGNLGQVLLDNPACIPLERIPSPAPVRALRRRGSLSLHGGSSDYG